MADDTIKEQTLREQVKSICTELSWDCCDNECDGWAHQKSGDDVKATKKIVALAESHATTKTRQALERVVLAVTSSIDPTKMPGNFNKAIKSELSRLEKQ